MYEICDKKMGIENKIAKRDNLILPRDTLVALVESMSIGDWELPDMHLSNFGSSVPQPSGPAHEKVKSRDCITI